MVNIISNYILLHPSMMMALFYPSYYISFILFLCLIYKFRITGTLLFVHSIITFFLLNPGVKIDITDPSFYDDTKFSPHIFDIPIYGLLSIPIIVFIGLLLDNKFYFEDQLKTKNSKK